MTNNSSINQISKSSDFILNIFFLLFALACVLPFILVVSVSLTSEHALVNYGYRFIPREFSFESYMFMFQNPQVLLNAYSVTIFVAAVGTFFGVLTKTMFAYPLSRSDFPFKKFFSTFILITMLFSGGFVSTYLIYVKVLHIKNTLLALILPSLGAGFDVFIIRTFLKQTIPEAIIESAKIDGAGEIRTFFRIVLPLAVPVIAAMSLFSVFGLWNDWQHSLYYITNPNLFSLQFVMQQALRNVEFMQQQLELQNPEAYRMQVPAESVRMAMVLAGIGPIIIAYPFFQKHFVKGLTIGAVKG